MKQILKFIFIDRGWLHVIGFFCLTYCVMYYGDWAIAEKVQTLPSVMVADLMRLPVFGQFLILMVLTAFFGWILERIEVKFSPGTKISLSDIACDIVGMALSVVAYMFSPQNKAVMLACALTVVSLATYLALSIYKARRK